MNIETAAKTLKELGHVTRLAVYKQVVRAGTDGISVGTLQEKLEIPGSTLSHHISSLVSASLITQRRESRTLFCVAEYEQLQQVISFLQDECCIDQLKP